MTSWLSYGGGVNSTAPAILLALGKLPQHREFRVVFADTGDENRRGALLRRHAEAQG